MQDSKSKLQNANGNIGNAAPSYRGGGASESLGLSPAAVDEAPRSQSTKLALLPLAFCVLTFAFALFLLPAPLRAQGCAMCYTSASAARTAGKEALANGTLILLIPPMVFFALITVIVYRYRNRYRETYMVNCGELPIADFRLPTEEIEHRHSAIGHPQWTTDHEPRSMGKHSSGAR
jgi:hypothetical protein